MALRSDVVLFDPVSGARQVVASVTHARPAMRLNDGKVGPDGAFWVGSMDSEGEAAKLYRVAPDGAVRIVAEGIATSNGLAWNAAATRLYHSDSRGSMWIDCWDFDIGNGATGNRRRANRHILAVDNRHGKRAGCLPAAAGIGKTVG